MALFSGLVTPISKGTGGDQCKQLGRLRLTFSEQFAQAARAAGPSAAMTALPSSRVCRPVGPPQPAVRGYGALKWGWCN